MKDKRVAQLEFILRAHPEGIRKSELARRIGVHRSTIGRYVDDLIMSGEVYEDCGLVKIHVNEQGGKQDLSVYESLAINMGAEMLLGNSQYQNPHLATGLRKIAMNMQESAPKISKNIMELAEEIEVASLKQTNNEMLNDVLEVLIDAWVSGRMVRVIHRTDEDEKEESEIAPYFIGFVEGEQGRKPITLTGRLRHTTEIITLDISRIRDVVILEETYTIPDNLKPFKIKEEVRSVNSVIDTIPLVLKIKEKSALNSFRTLAHSEIQITKKNDGTFVCKFDAENSIELMLRIIQGFDNIEILGPEKFRENFVKKLQQILQVYSH